MNQNTIPGTARKAHRSRSGIDLERSYIYLTANGWDALYTLATAQKLSASEYIASLLLTDHGTATKDLNDSSASPPPRND